MASIALALGSLREEVVFIGGAIAPLLQTEPVLDRVRATRDVDAIIASIRYDDVHQLHERLRELGFRHDATYRAHMHRFILEQPSGGGPPIAFDLVPAGAHLGASGNLWDVLAIETAVASVLPSGLVLRHAAAPAFLALKWSAHNDRGGHDPFNSHDLEDILGILACRPILLEEMHNVPLSMKIFVAECAAALLSDPDVEELVHDAVRGPSGLAGRVLTRLKALAALDLPKSGRSAVVPVAKK